jgi:hypothetical protein
MPVHVNNAYPIQSWRSDCTRRPTLSRASLRGRDFHLARHSTTCADPSRSPIQDYNAAKLTGGHSTVKRAPYPSCPHFPEPHSTWLSATVADTIEACPLGVPSPMHHVCVQNLPDPLRLFIFAIASGDLLRNALFPWPAPAPTRHSTPPFFCTYGRCNPIALLHLHQKQNNPALTWE